MTLPGQPQPTGIRLSVLIPYGIFALPLASLNLPLYIYVPTFYAETIGIPLAQIGVALLVARLLDVITDPIFGFLSDRTRSRFGRRKPWAIASLPLLALATWQLFLPDSDATVWHLLFWSCLAYLAWTVIILAYGAWGAELSEDYDERSTITSMREGFVIAGIVIAVGLPWLMGTEPGSRANLESMLWLMLVLLPLVGAILALFVPDPQRPIETPSNARLLLKDVMRNKPFRRLMIAYLLNGIANGLPATLFILFVDHVVGGDSGFFLLIYFLSGIVAVPFWLWLSRRFNKHRAWASAMIWACLIFSAAFWAAPGNPTAYLLICIFSGLSLGADLALPASMQADVVDYDEAQHGDRRTGIYFALWSMATKLSLAGAVGIAFPLLGLIGFDAQADNDQLALNGLIALYALAPVPIKLIAAALVWRFEIDRTAQLELRQNIKHTPEIA